MDSTIHQDMALRVLRIEQQVESYRRLHGEELDQIRREVEELREEVLALAQPEGSAAGRGIDSDE